VDEQIAGWILGINLDFDVSDQRFVRHVVLEKMLEARGQDPLNEEHGLTSRLHLEHLVHDGLEDLGQFFPVCLSEDHRGQGRRLTFRAGVDSAEDESHLQSVDWGGKRVRASSFQPCSNVEEEGLAVEGMSFLDVCDRAEIDIESALSAVEALEDRGYRAWMLGVRVWYYLGYP
jgi:hypothetical protein